MPDITNIKTQKVEAEGGTVVGAGASCTAPTLAPWKRRGNKINGSECLSLHVICSPVSKWLPSKATLPPETWCSREHHGLVEEVIANRTSSDLIASDAPCLPMEGTKRQPFFAVF